MLKQLFTAHPASVGETYFQHVGQAGSFARDLALAACACSIHAVLPFTFEKTASNLVAGLHDRMVVNRRRRSMLPDDPAVAATASLPH